MTGWPVIRTWPGLSRALAAPFTVLATPIRWAGHNKWSNIRHIKAEKDGLMAKVSRIQKKDSFNGFYFYRNFSFTPTKLL